MINAFYSARSGLLQSQNNLNVVSNNMANVNTTAFQSESANFTDLLYTNIPSESEAQGNLQNGNGAKLSSVSTAFSQGSITGTGRALDAAIEGDGFFCTQDSAGNTHYTRNGSFQLSNEDGKTYLVTADGEYVLDSDMKRIEVSSDTQVQKNSSISLAVVSFSNPYGLTRIGDNLYEATASSGEAVLSTDSKVVQGALESSNVDIASEMTKLIEAQRGFQLSAKVLQITDDMEQISNTLRT